MKNVGNWHWVDKNCLPWTKTYFTERLTGLCYESADKSRVEVSKVCEVAGQVDLNQRKGKLITIYDFELELEWKGSSAASGESATGRIKIPEFMHDSELSDIVFDVSMNQETRAKEPIKATLRQHLLPLIREAFSSFANDLMEENRGDVQIGTQQAASSKYKPAPPAPTVSGGKKDDAALGVVGALTTIEQSVELVGSQADIFSTLTEEQRCCIWTRGKAQIEAKAGGMFRFFDGNITGTIESLEPNVKIVQKWRSSGWPKEHYSLVTITLDDKGDRTQLKLKQTGVPVGERDQIESGWYSYYWNPMKQAF
ncbi:MAG: hypothetical protein SGCHY_004152, partial [Lobulomycetales sp.]